MPAIDADALRDAVGRQTTAALFAQICRSRGLPSEGFCSPLLCAPEVAAQLPAEILGQAYQRLLGNALDAAKPELPSAA